MTDTPLALEDTQSQETTEANFRECRKRLKLNAEQTDFESVAGDQIDAQRLLEYKREVLKVFVAGSTLGADERLYEKYRHLAELMATYVRVIGDTGEPIEMSSWSFLQQPEWMLDAAQRKNQSAAIAQVKAGEFVAETLFVSRETAGRAVAFIQELAKGGYGSYQMAETSAGT